jgi:hypothetical protein
MNCPVCGDDGPFQSDLPIALDLNPEPLILATPTPTDVVTGVVRQTEVKTYRCSECSTRFYEDPNDDEVKLAD